MAPLARDEMDTAAFNAMMQKGFNDANADRSRPVSDVHGMMIYSQKRTR